MVLECRMVVKMQRCTKRCMVVIWMSFPDITKIQPKRNVVWTSCVCWVGTSIGPRSDGLYSPYKDRENGYGCPERTVRPFCCHATNENSRRRYGAFGPSYFPRVTNRSLTGNEVRGPYPRTNMLVYFGVTGS